MLHVVVGVAIDDQQKILVAQRHQDVDHGSLWEFPGGKVEVDENPYDALCREFQEEVDIDILGAEPFIEVKHAYSKYSVLMDVWKIIAFAGQAKGAEGQLIRWVTFSELSQLTMPEANSPIIEKVLDIS